MKSNTYLLSGMLLIASIDVPITLQILFGSDIINIILSFSETGPENGDNFKSKNKNPGNTAFNKKWSNQQNYKKDHGFHNTLGIQNSDLSISYFVNSAGFYNSSQTRSSTLIASDNGIRAPPYLPQYSPN